VGHGTVFCTDKGTKTAVVHRLIAENLILNWVQVQSANTHISTVEV